MQKITSSDTLRRAIADIEQRQITEAMLFKEQFSMTFESLKPFNIISKAIEDFFSPSELKGHLLETFAGILSGYFSRILLVRNSKNPFLRLTGIFLQHVVTNIVSKKSDALLTVCSKLFQAYKVKSPPKTHEIFNQE